MIVERDRLEVASDFVVAAECKRTVGSAVHFVAAGAIELDQRVIAGVEVGIFGITLFQLDHHPPITRAHFRFEISQPDALFALSGLTSLEMLCVIKRNGSGIGCLK